jgi:phosphate transport system substrate-binding protein
MAYIACRWLNDRGEVDVLKIASRMTLSVVGLSTLFLPAAARCEIKIHGSDTMLILNRELAAEYGHHDASVKFNVLGGGSGRGIAALLEGRTHIAAASRAMKEKEKAAFEAKTGRRPREIVVALDGIGVYVHNNNPVGSLTLAELEGIFSGRTRNWSQVGGLDRRIDIYNRDKYSGTRAFIQEHVLGGRSFSDLAREVSTTAMLISCVSRNQGAIGYGGIAYSQGSHIIRVAERPGEVGVWPSRENVSSGEYPLSRPLYFYVDPESMDRTVRSFLDWVTSPGGQHVVTFVGYYPAPDAVAEAVPPEEQPVISHEPVLLTPENMKLHGFDLAITRRDHSGGTRPGQSSLEVRFSLAGHSIQRIRRMSIRIGEDAVIPLNLGPDLSVRFALRKGLIRSSSLYLSEAGAPRDGAIYVVQLSAFCP